MLKTNVKSCVYKHTIFDNVNTHRRVLKNTAKNNALLTNFIFCLL